MSVHEMKQDCKLNLFDFQGPWSGSSPASGIDDFSTLAYKSLLWKAKK